MATLHDVRRPGRRYQHRPNPHAAECERQARAELGKAIADQFRGRHRPVRVSAYVPVITSASSSVTITTPITITAGGGGDQGGWWGWTNTASTMDLGRYWTAAAGTGGLVMTNHRPIAQNTWDGWITSGRQVRSMDDLTNNRQGGKAWRLWVAGDTAPAVHPRPGMVHDWKEGDWVSRKVYNRRQTIREAEANRIHDLQMARQHAREAADIRATELLMSLLTPDQQQQYLEQGAIEMVTASGRHMQLRKGWAGNVAELCPVTRRPLRRFCIHPRVALPEADNVVAQLLLLQADEDLFFATANASAVR